MKAEKIIIMRLKTILRQSNNSDSYLKLVVQSNVTNASSSYILRDFDAEYSSKIEPQQQLSSSS